MLTPPTALDTANNEPLSVRVRHWIEAKGDTVKDQVRIDWSYAGKPDYSAGTGATSTERFLPIAAGVALALWLAFDVWRSETPWGWGARALGLLVAFDIGGGAVANGLNTCKRFYGTPAKPDEGWPARLLKNHLLFAMAHIHALVVWAVWAPAAWIVGLGWYGLLIAATLVTLATPLYLRRPVAMALVGLAIVLNGLPSASLPHLAWLQPLLFLKIVLGHSVREEPYRP